MHELALAAGEDRFTAALNPFSVDGMILASSINLRRGLAPDIAVPCRSGSADPAAPEPLTVAGHRTATPRRQ